MLATMSFQRATSITILLCCLLSPAMSVADDAAGPESSPEYDHNAVGFFVGGTGEGRRENGLTLAFVYARRFQESFAIEFEAERVFGDLDFWVVTIPFVYHYNKWKFAVGPGLEKPDDGDSEFLLRIGTEYAFELNESWELAPTFNLDFVDGETVMVVGVGLIYGY
jgi:hypothetical protein